MFMHELIKIKYIHEGYLPDHPYRSISDQEMFEAFLGEDEGYFITMYPCPDDAVLDQYTALKNDIFKNVQTAMLTGQELPPWIYSYMLGESIGPYSDDVEIEYINTLMNVDIPVTTVFSRETAQSIYAISQDWLKKMEFKYDTRVPTIFGEPHVIKSLRLKDVDVLGG